MNKPLILLAFLAILLLIKFYKNNTKISIFVFFLILLFSLPLLNINLKSISQSENRALKNQPQLFGNSVLNFNYAKDYDDFLEDRFFGRYVLSKFVQDFKCTINTTTCGKQVLLNKKFGWTYVTGFLPRSNVDLDLIYSNLSKLREFCEKNEMQLFVLIAPTKGVLYPEAVYPNIPILLDYKTLLKNQVVYPYDELIEAKKSDFVMSKYDEHWTEYAAFVAYTALMQRIKKDIPSLKILSENDFIVKKQNTIRTMIPYDYSYGFNAKTFGIKDFPDLYKTYIYPHDDDLQIAIDEETGNFVSHLKKSPNPQRLYLIGSSYSDNLSLFLRYSFSDVKKANSLSVSQQSDDLRMKVYEDDILKFKPNILLVAVTVAAVPALETMYESEDNNAI